MTQQEFQQPYNRQAWQTELQNIFGSQIQFEAQPENVVLNLQNSPAKSIQRFASIKLADGKNLAVLDIAVAENVKIAKNRVGLRELVAQFIDHARYHGILAFYHCRDVACRVSTGEYRLSFISSEPKIDAETGEFSIEQTAPKRFTYILGENVPCRTFSDRMQKIAEKRGNIALDDVKDAFAVETLTKEFYSELSNWYFWALQNVQFPQGDNEVSVIRLITRLMFVWFIKQKHLPTRHCGLDPQSPQSLIPNEIFEKETLGKLLNYKDKTRSTYYKAILQNLFFATLNTEMGDKRKFVNRQSGIQGFFRYERFFNDKEKFVELMKNIPFLNGGLFENLDKNVGEENEIRIDCFSNRLDKEELLKVPDFLFFSEEKQVDLNTTYDTKGKTYKVRGLIDILQAYNFTIEENTPDDIEVALDPELLGKVFENLLASFNPETQTTARKQTGSFYTPREIVDYMVEESLKAYLLSEPGFPQDSKDFQDYKTLVEYLFSTQNLDNQENLNKIAVQTIIQTIQAAKILDPACGSGAFPMGVLQKMVQILQKIDPKNELWKQRQLALAEKIEDEKAREFAVNNIQEAFEENELDYGRKLFLIENCIFGIDIQPIAVQISKLRFFISLVCEQTPNAEKPNLGIRPLPNLETKFVAANSLIGLEKPLQMTFGMDQIEPLEKELAEVRHKHFSARTPETKRKYREKDADLRTQIAQKLKEIGFNNSTAEKIASWNPYDQNTSSPFFDPEWMFGITPAVIAGNDPQSPVPNRHCGLDPQSPETGFDIIIGNPPYVQLQNNGGALAKQFENCGYKTFARTGDIYCLFYERGWQLLKPQGHLCFITSNKWMRAGYGENTRRFFAENTNPTLLIDFAGVKVFDSATVDVNILMFQKDKNRQETSACIVKKSGIKDLGVFVRQNAVPFVTRHCGLDPQSPANGDSWVVLSPIEQRIKQKIEAVGTPLKEWDINIYRGVLTGFNKAFIINGATKAELIAADPKSAEIIRPILRGRDIKRYGYDFADLWLINTHNGYTRHCGLDPQSPKNEKVPPVNINDYPAVKQHLNSYWTQIEKRQDQGDTPYNLRNCAYIEDFYRQKIAWNRIASEKLFSLVDEGIFIQDSMHFFTGNHLKFLCAILNSKLFVWLMYLIVGDAAGGNAGNADNVKNLTIPIPNTEIEQRIEKLLQNKDYQAIDNVVYKLYGLTESEINFIENM